MSLGAGTAAALQEELCGDAICGTYGNAPRFDDSNRPPSKNALGRATWTFLHVTAAYLPEKMNPTQLKSFLILANAPAHLYPGKGGALYRSILADPQVKEEMNAIQTREDAMLFIWKSTARTTLSSSPLRCHDSCLQCVSCQYLGVRDVVARLPADRAGLFFWQCTTL